MPRESLASKKKRAEEVCQRMEEKYGGAESALDYYNPYTLLIAVMLSAQTTDAGGPLASKRKNRLRDSSFHVRSSLCCLFHPLPKF